MCIHAWYKNKFIRPKMFSFKTFFFVQSLLSTIIHSYWDLWDWDLPFSYDFTLWFFLVWPRFLLFQTRVFIKMSEHPKRCSPSWQRRHSQGPAPAYGSWSQLTHFKCFPILNFGSYSYFLLLSFWGSLYILATNPLSGISSAIFLPFCRLSPSVDYLLCGPEAPSFNTVIHVCFYYGFLCFRNLVPKCLCPPPCHGTFLLYFLLCIS